MPQRRILRKKSSARSEEPTRKSNEQKTPRKNPLWSEPIPTSILLCVQKRKALLLFTHRYLYRLTLARRCEAEALPPSSRFGHLLKEFASLQEHKNRLRQQLLEFAG